MAARLAVSDEGERLNELMDVLIALARKDYSRRATVGSGENPSLFRCNLRHRRTEPVHVIE